jgi:hypothetical protein
MNEKETSLGGQEEQKPQANVSQAAAEAPEALEVVEYYDQSAQNEVVEYFVQPIPLPRRPSAGQPQPVKKKHRRKAIGLFLLCAALLAGLAAGAFVLGQNEGKKESGGKSNSQQTEKDDTAKVSIPKYTGKRNVQFRVTTVHGSALTPQEIYRKVNPAVVTVMVQLDGSAAVGTGVIFTSDGYVLTNYHVVAGGKDCSVTLSNNGTYAAEYVAGDANNDVAILKINRKNLPTAQIGSSDALTVGDAVYAIGNPLGTELRGTFTDGIVSAINRDVEVSGRNMTLIQTNAALNSGNSGGPLINVYGRRSLNSASPWKNWEPRWRTAPSARKSSLWSLAPPLQRLHIPPFQRRRRCPRTWSGPDRRPPAPGSSRFTTWKQEPQRTCSAADVKRHHEQRGGFHLAGLHAQPLPGIPLVLELVPHGGLLRAVLAVKAVLALDHAGVQGIAQCFRGRHQAAGHARSPARREIRWGRIRSWCAHSGRRRWPPPCPRP